MTNQTRAPEDLTVIAAAIHSVCTEVQDRVSKLRNALPQIAQLASAQDFFADACGVLINELSMLADFTEPFTKGPCRATKQIQETLEDYAVRLTGIINDWKSLVAFGEEVWA